MKRKLFFIPLILAIVGLIDASYLTVEHFSKVIPPCHLNRFLPILSDCGLVLQSKYAMMFGIPIALLGAISYGVLILAILLAIITNKKALWLWILIQTKAAVVFSLYLMFLQLFVIKSICIYCTVSAFISFAIFIVSLTWLEMERKMIIIYLGGYFYRNILKRILFLINPETIHVKIVTVGELLGKIPFIKSVMQFVLPIYHEKLTQYIENMRFNNPVGLAAGFDYHAQLTQILPALGFGFGSVGTITNFPYEGNEKPMLGRLPISQSLMVNKGYKNLGAAETIKKIERLHFQIPVGISIGRTNSQQHTTQIQSVQDVVMAFKKFESTNVENAYYELNISCPNLYGNISFYPPNNLLQLLTALDKLRIKKLVFVKMPIEKSDKEFLTMLSVIDKFKYIKGLIIGNLQKNRKDPSLDPQEVAQFKVGNFSGKPCEKRSNELIRLAYKQYGQRFVIIGCGGIFSAQDAYKKIKLGASLVQLITGMIFQGPTLIAQINLELTDLLKKDSFKNIKEAIGSEV